MVTIRMGIDSIYKLQINFMFSMENLARNDQKFEVFF